MYRAFQVPSSTAGLTQGAFMTLCALEERGELTASELAALHGISKAGVSQLLRTLENNGFVARHNRSADRRVVAVCLTEAGRAVVREANATLEAMMTRVVDAMGQQDTRDLAALLARFCDLLENTQAQEVRGRREKNCVDT